MRNAASHVLVEQFAVALKFLELLVMVKEVAECSRASTFTVWPSLSKCFERLNHQTRNRHDGKPVLVFALCNRTDIPFHESFVESIRYLVLILVGFSLLIVLDSKPGREFGEFWILNGWRLGETPFDQNLGPHLEACQKCRMSTTLGFMRTR